ncbi:metal ABC transporter substrate-binding protein [Helcobacillus massiliensis]|uniref:metal ABC transporter substrate-binding protein n=1 Tax=Helcobacillus massiliensis TaxID=521392 RepID=UPI0021A96463|nr:metal ABC transporter substrate-binding protein [Helcobacillus massiliensis]MCT1557151.1 metal ABC transporter substrate-binding protein [Helcobacillus massiliensis]MCT2036114.1 metal ABC transporter substrate-binding protein [Helcobacillus massiliensis]MCT2331245.1 metal ABC transporter substrate-binding protein [Helcobacillus massiliensis]
MNEVTPSAPAPTPQRTRMPHLSAALTRRSFGALLGGGALAAALAACGGKSADGDGVSVVATCYPLVHIAQRIGGDAVTIINPVKPGVDPHGLELSPAQATEITQADVLVHITGYQAAVDDLVKQQKPDNVLAVHEVTDLLHAGESAEEHADHADHGDEHDHAGEGHDGHDHGIYDPHFWFDPTKMAEVATALAKRLGEIDTSGASDFEQRAKSFTADMKKLDAQLKSTFDSVSGPKTFITSHEAFGYLAARYGLKQVGISGIDPESEPSPKRLRDLQKVIKDEGVTTVFFETTASPKVAKSLADSTGAKAEELDNLEQQLDEKKDYSQVMIEDAEKLVASWQ